MLACVFLWLCVCVIVSEWSSEFFLSPEQSVDVNAIEGHKKVDRIVCVPKEERHTLTVEKADKKAIQTLSRTMVVTLNEKWDTHKHTQATQHTKHKHTHEKCYLNWP